MLKECPNTKAICKDLFVSRYLRKSPSNHYLTITLVKNKDFSGHTRERIVFQNIV